MPGVEIIYSVCSFSETSPQEIFASGFFEEALLIDLTKNAFPFTRFQVSEKAFQTLKNCFNCKSVYASLQ